MRNESFWSYGQSKGQALLRDSHDFNLAMIQKICLIELGNIRIIKKPKPLEFS